MIPSSMCCSFSCLSFSPTRKVGVVLGSLLVAMGVALPTFAAQVEILRVADRATVLEGETEGVSVGPLGELSTSTKVEELIALDEPFVFTAASTPRGWLLGTGNEGKVLFVNREGGTRVVGRLPEPEVFAVQGLRDGSWIAAGSPNGKVYRVTGSGLEELFDPEATYVWALAEDSQGRILAATGLPGRLVRWDGKRLEVLYESPDAHVRALLVSGDGGALLGTAGQGLVVRLSPQGAVRTLHDADEPEVLALAEKDGKVYAALLASEASFVDLSSSGDGEEGADSSNPTIGSRAGDHEGPRSAVIAIDADGTVDRLAQVTDETIHAMTFFGSGEAAEQLWIGTGQEGHLYRLEGDELIREAQLEPRQLVALAPGPGEGPRQKLAVVTANGAAVFQLGKERHSKGSYSSKIHDLGQSSDFGVFRWRGDAGGTGSVRVAIRTGMSAEPDGTWTEWSEAVTVDPRQELSLAGKSGRFLQWRLDLNDAGTNSPVIRETELTYRQRNRAPEIVSLEVQDPGKILVPQSFNPTSTTFEPWSPNRDGIFTSVRKEKESSQVKSLWKKGYRTLKWEAEDDNEDSLSYRLEVKPADGGSWVTMVDELEDAWFSFDSTVLPDGVYRFRVTASDAADNPPDRALTGTEISEPVTVDHSPPALIGKPTVEPDRRRVEVGDTGSPLRSVEYSVDGQNWQPANPLDGLLDSRREVLEIELPDDAGWVLLRLTDAAFNVVTLDLSRP